MTEAKFKIGDKVRCIDPVDDLVYGKEYNVTFVNDALTRTLISVEGGVYDGGYYEHRFELVEPAPKPFTKGSLKTGMRVVTRDGCIWIVVLGVKGKDIVVSENQGWSCLSDYDDKLLKVEKCLSQYDIMEVYDMVNHGSLFNHKVLGSLLWKREEETPEQKRIKEIDAKIKVLEEEKKALLSLADER